MDRFGFFRDIFFDMMCYYGFDFGLLFCFVVFFLVLYVQFLIVEYEVFLERFELFLIQCEVNDGYVGYMYWKKLFDVGMGIFLQLYVFIWYQMVG